MNIRSILTTPNVPGKPLFAYGFLLLIAALLLWNIQVWWTTPASYPYDRYANFVVALMLLFNHLASQFRWPGAMTAAMRLLSWGWLVFGLFYLFYWSHILFPVNVKSP